jgi:predicted RNase H-like HicB family nuclease
MQLTVVVREEGSGYWSQVREVPGCFASGGTLDELREALGEAIGLCLFDRPVSLGQQSLSVGEVRIVVESP